MLASFVMSMALAAPVPVAPPAPVAGGPIPQLMEFKPDASGKIMVTVIRTEMQKIVIGQGGAVNPNGGAPAVITREVPVTKHATVELSEVKDLKVTTADGKKLEVADAVAKLKAGGVVVVSADGKPVSPMHLKLFKDDVLVFASPELQPAQLNGYMPGKPLPGGGIIRPRPPIQIQPLPGNVVPLPAPIQPVPGIQIQPGVIQIEIVPALPAPQPAPAPAPEK
ncbi:MAG: hypothetical protein FJ304_26500 [Planctomycetes bacterium]|nr:hypothetical protein [Planctomycetota bacterium]